MGRDHDRARDRAPVAGRYREPARNFTDLAATAIGNVSAHEQLRQVADEQAALRRVATLVARGVSPDVVFGAVAQEVAHVLPAVDHAVIGRYTSRQSVEFVGGWSRAGESDWVGKTTALGGHNVSTAVFETRQPARVDHLDDEASPTTAIARRVAPGPRPARRSTSRGGSGGS